MTTFAINCSFTLTIWDMDLDTIIVQKNNVMNVAIDNEYFNNSICF